MIREQNVGLVIVLLLTGSAVLFALLLILRFSKPLLRPVFSRETDLLARRAAVGFLDLEFAIVGAGLFDMSRLILGPVFFGRAAELTAMAATKLVLGPVGLVGLTLWVLALLQFFGGLFRKKEKSAPEPQSNP